jgi:hypothetical protein
MRKQLTLIDGVPIIGTVRQRIIPQYVPLPVLDRVKDLTERFSQGKITQAQVDEQWAMYVLPHLKLPPDYNRETDTVDLRVQRKIQSTLVRP